MDNFYEHLTDDEDFIDMINLNIPRHYRPVIQERINYFHYYDDQDFIKRFRLSKQGTRFIINQIRDQIASPTNQ